MRRGLCELGDWGRPGDDERVLMVEGMKEDGTNVAAAVAEDLPAHLPGLILRERELCATRLASTLIHALGTPLQVIAGRAALAVRAGRLEEASPHLEVIQRKCGEITTLLWRVLDSLRTERSRTMARIDVQPFVQRQLDRLALIASARGVRWSLRVGAARQPMSVHLCAEDLAHALLSLGVNVLAEAPDGSELTVAVDRVEPGAVALTPVHEGLLCMTFRRAAAGPAVQNPADPWSGPESTQVDGRALGWATVFELARSNEGRLEVTEEAAVLYWPTFSDEGSNEGSNEG